MTTSNQTTAQHTPDDYLSEAGIEARKQFNAQVIERAASMSVEEARVILEGADRLIAFCNKRGGKGVHALLVSREAARIIVAENHMADHVDGYDRDDIGESQNF